MHYDGFFIGWRARLPRGLGLFLALVALMLLGIALGMAGSLALSVNDPGNGGFDWGAGRQEMSGIVTAEPYPLLHVPKEGGGVRTLLLAGQGKRGVQARVAPLDGQRVDVSGILIRRGGIDMLQIGGPIGLRAAEDPSVFPEGFTLPEAQSLGRWRISGEICDGKCYLGAMRPGTGLAHKACANLCLVGGAPAVLVTQSSIDGEQFFVLADPEGRPLPSEALHKVALLLELEGDVERRGGVLLFRTDIEKARIL